MSTKTPNGTIEETWPLTCTEEYLLDHTWSHSLAIPTWTYLTYLSFSTILAWKRFWHEISQQVCLVLTQKLVHYWQVFLPTTSQRRLFLRNPLVLVESRRSYIMVHHSATVLQAWFPFPFHFSQEFSSLKSLSNKVKVGPGSKSICQSPVHKKSNR